MKVTKEQIITILKYLIPFLVGAAMLAGISWWVAEVMQDMRPEIREELITVLDSQRPMPEKETVSFHWEPELLVAQQLGNALRLNRPENLRMVLENVEQNIQFIRNKPAAYFYLAEVYEQQGNKDRALELYETIKEDYYNRNITILPGLQRTTEDAPRYSVSLVEEALYRIFLLKRTDESLQVLHESTNAFGPDGNPGFLYADLAAEATKGGTPGSSWEYYTRRLSQAESYLRRYIAFAQNEDLEQAGRMVTGGASRTLEIDVDRIHTLKYQDELTLTLESIRKDRNDYLYIFLYNETDLRFTLRDNLRGRLIIERVQR